jgi:hypothetical protein
MDSGDFWRTGQGEFHTDICVCGIKAINAKRRMIGWQGLN